MKYRTGSSAQFAQLLDRSIEQLIGASADAREFDVGLIHRVADVWDNNSSPLVEVATAAGRRREQLAWGALSWMAHFRRQWMVDTVPGLGDLPTVSALGSRTYRDYQGRVCPGTAFLSEVEACAWDADYDLSSARLRHLAADRERAGLTATLVFEVDRRFLSENDDPALLQITLNGIGELQFDAGDRRGLTFERTGHGVRVRFGSNGVVHGESGTAWLDDRFWHESQAGVAADRVTPPWDPDARRMRDHRVQLEGTALRVAQILHMAMLHIRMVRHLPEAARIPVHRLSLGLANAGSDLLAAGHREDSLRRVAEQWRARCGSLEPEPPPPMPTGVVQVNHARFTATHTRWGRQQQSTAGLLVAAPQSDRDSPWRLAGSEMAEPTRCAITLAMFTGEQSMREITESMIVARR